MSNLLMLNPGFVVILAGVICALLPVGAVRKALVLAAPAFAAVMIFNAFNAGGAAQYVISVGPVDLTLMRIDRLAMLWGYVFCLAGVLNAIYGFHEKCRITDSSALIYMGAALSGVLEQVIEHCLLLFHLRLHGFHQVVGAQHAAVPRGDLV